MKPRLLAAPPEIYQVARRRLPASLCKSSLRTYFDWEDRGDDDYAARPVILDLFCGGGGSAVGYFDAGFRVIGVDNRPQPRYPFTFIQADALEYVAAHGTEFDAIHASPPCQAYSEATPIGYRKNHPDLIIPTQVLLAATSNPYAIENVAGARALLTNPVMLCGSMFGLCLQRHRYFEIWPDILRLTPSCNHAEYPILITGTTRRKSGRFEYSISECRMASGIDWMTRKEIDQAIPPVYTEFVGRQLMNALK